jgi:hypothetical protein
MIADCSKVVAIYLFAQIPRALVVPGGWQRAS